MLRLENYLFVKENAEVFCAEKTDEFTSHPLSSKNTMLLAVDFSDEQQINEALKTIVERFGGVDNCSLSSVFINNYFKM